MDGPLATVVLIGSIVCNGLLAGVFFAFACAILPGLRRVDDRTYVTTFRAVNRAILNGWFLTVFMAAPLLAIVAVVVSSPRVTGPWLVVGLACAIATFVITAAVNVPLNRRLDAAPTQTDPEARAARHGFEQRWTSAHLVRTITSIGAAVFPAVAVVL